ncbi:MAG: hypothetical protein JWL70_2363 [Acidimicrobiia bacterium]|nr:hypothetical protein [Acidimicrobiia bacterium]
MLSRSVRLTASALVVALVGLSACSGSSDNKASASSLATSSTSGRDASTAPTPGPSATGAPSTAPVTTPPTYAKVVFTRTIAQGDKGDDTARIQQRLKDLAFDPGPVDGKYGLTTTQAVWAFQHLAGITGKAADGKVSPDLWNKMQDPMVLAPMDNQSTATHVEIDLVKQVAIVWNGATPRLITHISSGSGRNWCENGWCGVAVTPPGAYKFTRRIAGWRQAVLGLLYNPVYFNGGIAMHGAPSVPNGPASHGCIRLPMHIADYFPTLVKNGDDVLVFDGVKPARAYGQISPPANRVDPTATTKVPADPLDTAPAAPVTTVPGATTVPPPTSSTTKPAPKPPVKATATTKP